MTNHNLKDHSINLFNDKVSADALAIFRKLLENNVVIFKHVRARSTKYGDFKYFRNNKSPVISVNQNLSSDALTFILAHEISHFLVYKQNRHTSPPHGEKWKKVFGSVLNDLIFHSCFSEECAGELAWFALHPRATVPRNMKLHGFLFPFTDSHSGMVELDQLSEGTLFMIPGRKNIYKKQEKRRTRYVCQCLGTKKRYLVSRNLKVNTLNN